MTLFLSNHRCRYNLIRDSFFLGQILQIFVRHQFGLPAIQASQMETISRRTESLRLGFDFRGLTLLTYDAQF